MHRTNKHQPSKQLISKRPVSTLRVAPGLAPAGSARQGRDPRFGDNCFFDESGWRQSYDFLYKQRDEELKQGKQGKQGKKTHADRNAAKKRALSEAAAKSPEELAELERAKSRRLEGEKQAKRQRVKADMRAEELEAVKQGKKPFFLKRSAVRERELVLQYEELKKNPAKLESFMEKRRKKNSAKQHRRMPARREVPF